MRGGKGKLEKFAELSHLPNVYQNFNWHEPQLIHLEQSVDIKGKWKEQVFQNNNPITLELACGYGEYTVAIASRFSNKNVIGIDVKGNRIWRGAKQLLDQHLNNGAFLRTTIDRLPHFFAPNEIEEIWITFPDPHRKSKKGTNRLTSPYYLAIYRQFLVNNGTIHLKTDSTLLYEFTLAVLQQENITPQINYKDVYSQPNLNELLTIKTRYERANPSNADTMKYLQFQLDGRCAG